MLRPGPADLDASDVPVFSRLNVDQIDQSDGRLVEEMLSIQRIDDLLRQSGRRSADDGVRIADLPIELRRPQPPEHHAHTVLDVLNAEVLVLLAQG